MPDLVVTTDNRVTTITIDRQASKNSLNDASYLALISALRTAAADDDVRVVVIQGGDSIFTAGNEIPDFIELAPTWADAAVLEFLRVVAEFPKPLVGAVCGPAIGIGTTMLLHFDLVYAGDNARFTAPFTDLGVNPEAGSSLLFPELVGHRRAFEIMLLGEGFSAAEAREMGLVNKVLPAAEVSDYAQKTAARLAAKPNRALTAGRQLLKDGRRDLVQARMAAENKVFEELLNEPAAQEAFAAFLEKRKPDFEGIDM